MVEMRGQREKERDGYPSNSCPKAMSFGFSSGTYALLGH